MKIWFALGALGSAVLIVLGLMYDDELTLLLGSAGLIAHGGLFLTRSDKK